MLNLQVTCTECAKEYELPRLEMYKFAYNDSLTAVIKCKYGHESLMVLQNEKFEVLFDFACEAFLKGDYRNAVFNAADALERFYEFFVKVIMIKNKVTKEHYEKLWALVRNQSERQLGGFYYIYLLEFQENVPKFEQSRVSFRNKVIHKGYIPEKKETYEYLNYIYIYIETILSKIKLCENYKRFICDVVQWNFKERIPENNKYPIATVCMNSVIGLYVDSENLEEKNFSYRLNLFSDQQKMMDKLENNPFLSIVLEGLNKLKK